MGPYRGWEESIGVGGAYRAQDTHRDPMGVGGAYGAIYGVGGVYREPIGDGRGL